MPNYDSEKYLERKLRIEVEKLDGKCLKWVSPGFNAVPDRIVFIPLGHIFFVELKSKGEKPRPLQVYVHELLRKLGFKVYVIDNLTDLNKFIDEIRSL